MPDKIWRVEFTVIEKYGLERTYVEYFEEQDEAAEIYKAWSTDVQKNIKPGSIQINCYNVGVKPRDREPYE